MTPSTPIFPKTRIFRKSKNQRMSARRLRPRRLQPKPTRRLSLTLTPWPRNPKRRRLKQPRRSAVSTMTRSPSILTPSTPIYPKTRIFRRSKNQRMSARRLRPRRLQPNPTQRLSLTLMLCRTIGKPTLRRLKKSLISTTRSPSILMPSTPISTKTRTCRSLTHRTRPSRRRPGWRSPMDGSRS